MLRRRASTAFKAVRSPSFRFERRHLGISQRITSSSTNNLTLPYRAASEHFLRHSSLPFRSLSTSSFKKKKTNKPQKASATATTTETDSTDLASRIQPRPPGEMEIETKFPLPDRDKERELSHIQVEVHELYKAGDYTRSLESAKTLQTETEDHFGKEHPATAAAYNNIALMHKLLGDFDESRGQYQTALKIYKNTVGTDHASYASILHNMGNLNRSQIHFDGSLRATDRLSLMETALDYLEQAYTIRVQEMGPEHPHTVASRSSWGTTVATQILHHHKMTTSTDPAAKRQYISLLPTAVAESGWQAAQDHLQAALKMAVENPRGPSLKKKERSKKTKNKNKQADAAAAAGIQTLSAASAAQNLAVFLKTRATTISPYHEEWLEQAHTLYKDVLSVRSQLLPASHPDLYATKYSLAELLETMGDEEAANVVRQEIVDTYDPPEEDAAATSEGVEVTQTAAAAESKQP